MVWNFLRRMFSVSPPSRPQAEVMADIKARLGDRISNPPVPIKGTGFDPKLAGPAGARGPTAMNKVAKDIRTRLPPAKRKRLKSNKTKPKSSTKPRR